MNKPLLAFLAVAFLAYFKTAAQFLTQYLEDAKFLTPEQVYQQVYPIWTYAQLALLLAFAVCSEYFCGCKPVVLLGLLSLALEPLLLLLCSSLAALQLVEVVAASGAAALIVFSTFVYRALPPAVYQRATSFLRASFLLGTLLSSLLGQLLLVLSSASSASPDPSSSPFFPPHSLSPSLSPIAFMLALTVAGMLLALLLALLLLPSDFDASSPDRLASVPAEARALLRAWRPTAALSLWTVVSLAAHSLALTYYQLLFAADDPSVNYNGYVQAASYLLAALAASLPGVFYRRIAFPSAAAATLLLCATAAASAALLLLLGWVRLLPAAYAMFIAYHCLFEFSMTVASFQIAAELQRHAGAPPTGAALPPRMAQPHVTLVFSANTMASIVFQVLLQVVIGQGVLNLTPSQYFIAFGVIMGTLALVLGAFLLRSLYYSKLNPPPSPPAERLLSIQSL